MTKLTVTSGPRDGGASTDLYSVTGPGGATGMLAAMSLDVDLSVGQIIDAPPAPAHLNGVEFNGHTVDYVLPPAY